MERNPLFKRFGYFDKEYLHFIPYGDMIQTINNINNLKRLNYEKINSFFYACI